MLLPWLLWGGQGSREVRSFVLDEASLQERYASKSPLYKDDVLAGDWYGPFSPPAHILEAYHKFFARGRMECIYLILHT